MPQHKGAIPWNKGIKTGLVPKTAFKKGCTSPRKGKLGKPLSEDHKKAISEGVKINLPSTAFNPGEHFHSDTEFKKGENIGETNFNWKGDKVSYVSLHAWVRRKLGTPSKCEDCGNTNAKRYEWANISGKYFRNIKDWKRLCKSCHMAFDDVMGKAWQTRRGGASIF